MENKEITQLPQDTAPCKNPAPAEPDPPAEPQPPAETVTEEPAEPAPQSPEPEAVEIGADDTVVIDDPQRTARRIRRKKIFRGALRFYAFLFGFILCGLILLVCLMNPLQTLLTQYESAQPQYVAQEIFDTLYADPDWALLYDMSGIEPTRFEGRNEYVTYMEAKVGDQPLEYVEVPAGLSGDKRYSIRLNGEEVATFTMLPVDDGVSTFGRWTFGEAKVYFTREKSVTVTIMPGYTVYINGVPLDDSYTTLQISTVAEDYLPEGLHGYRYVQQQIGGLLVQPEVVVLDEYNNPVELTQDPVTGIYTTPITNTVHMTWGEGELILETVQADALFAIREISVGDLREYFASNSQAYEAITAGEALVKSFESYAFDESATVIRDFYRYSDDLFSVWAEVKLDVTDKKGNVTSYTVGGTYFFTPNILGNYMATEKYDVDLQAQRTGPFEDEVA